MSFPENGMFPMLVVMLLVLFPGAARSFFYPEKQLFNYLTRHVN